MIIDLQFGSTGKGLFAGYLSMGGHYDVAISANMPNAGHTYIDGKGNKFIFKVLPSAAVHCPYVLIGPGAVFDIDRLLFEMDQIRNSPYEMPMVIVHPNAMILQDYHRAHEQKHMTHIASTAQGSAEAVIEKMRRGADVQLAGNFEMGTVEQYRNIIDTATRIIAEGSQGYSLGIDTPFYPFVTSRNCTPAAFLDAMGLPHYYLDKVYGTARTFPIRVGGTSGPGYPDQTEVDWSDLAVTPERTTVTDRIRRVFTFSYLQMKEAIWACEPDAIFLNFCNYFKDPNQRLIIESFLDGEDCPVKWEGWGPTSNDVKEL